MTDKENKMTDKEYERILKEYFMVLEKYKKLDYAYLELEKKYNAVKMGHEKLFKANIRLTTENADLKKLMGIIEGKLLETCELIDKEFRGDEI